MSRPVNKEIDLYKQVKSKLDYRKVCELTNFSPHSKQNDILNKTQEGDFNVMVCLLPRRFGKSTTMSEIAFAELLCPYASILLITPKFKNAQNIFNMVEKLVVELNLPIKTKDIKSLTFTLENGASFSVVTKKNYESALGNRFSLVIVDETGSIDDIYEIWETYISPAQTDYGLQKNGYLWSKTYFIGTARHYETDFYKLYEKAVNKERGYIYIEATIYDNELISPELIETLKEKSDKKTWEQEYLCIWQQNGDGETVYYSFNSEKHIVQHQEILDKITKENTYIVGLDWGYTDNTALVIGVVFPFSGEIYILDEYAMSSLPLEQHTNQFRHKESIYTITEPHRFGDPSGSQVIAELAYQHNYFVQPAPIALEEAIRTINDLFSKDKLFISDNCHQLIKEVKTMQWKDRQSKKISRDKNKHYDLALGAFRYAIFGWEKNKELTIQVL